MDSQVRVLDPAAAGQPLEKPQPGTTEIQRRFRCAALYARVSTDRQEKERTVESQLADLQAIAPKISSSTCGAYVNDGYSGELLNRPALDRLRDDARNGLFDVLIVPCPDRLSRKFVHQCLIEEELKALGVTILYLNRPDAKDTPEDNLSIRIQSLVAEYEKTKILERTRRGKLHKAKKGRLVGGKAPYGYLYLPGGTSRDGIARLRVLKEEAKIVRFIFRLLLKRRMGIRTIAKELNRKGTQPPKGKCWHHSAVQRILTNETYTGVTYYNKHRSVEPPGGSGNGKYRRTKNTSQRVRPKEEWIRIALPKELRIISRETYRRAQEQLDTNSRRSPRNTRNRYLLRGLVKCGRCGAAVGGTPCPGTLYYKCGDRSRSAASRTGCRARSVRADALEEAVWKMLTETLSNPELVKRQLSRIKSARSKASKGPQRRIKSIDRLLTETANEEGRILDAYREGLLSLHELKSQKAKISEKRQRLLAERDTLSSKTGDGMAGLPDDMTVERCCNLIEARLKGLQDDFDGKRYLVSLLVNKIVLGDKTATIKAVLPLDTNSLREKPRRNVEFELVATLPQ